MKKQFKEYAKKAVKTWDKDCFDPEYYINNKIVAELGELLGAYVNYEIHGASIEKVILEAGDCFWYFAMREEILKERCMCFEGSSDGIPENILKNSINVAIQGDYEYSFYCFMCFIKTIGLGIKEILNKNLEKLEKRHGEKYNPAYYRGV